jgi:hypothetical protein
MKLDRESAWAELCRFAEANQLTLDERSAPGWKGEIGEKDTDPTDYSPVIDPIRKGQFEVSDTGALTVNLVRPNDGAPGKLVFDAATFHYGKAMMKMANATGAKLGKMYIFLESLAGVPFGTIANLPGRTDINNMTHLAALMLSE